MSNVFFTGDQHFGHSRIIDYCNRPFANAKDMDAEMIRRWNSVVRPGDTVYHLGDFTMENYNFAKSIFAQLNGEIRYLASPWHHDKRWLNKARSAPPYSLDRVFIYRLPPIEVLHGSRHSGDHKTTSCPTITLCHYPMAAWEASYHGAWHLHAHSHGEYDGGGFMLDVGVDRWDFAPVSLEEVRLFMKTREGEKHARQGG